MHVHARSLLAAARGHRPFRVSQLALLGQSASSFPGFRPFRLPQLALTCRSTGLPLLEVY